MPVEGVAGRIRSKPRHDGLAESFGERTVRQIGWAACSKGELLRLAADHDFDVLATVDQRFANQQSVRDLPNPLVLTIIDRVRFQELRPSS